ncbi:DUF1588 domain-containing protein [Marinagarivorans algicola]|uniref:DUF1588 domain-containing protein n=1 Tax=Marinagarivorans algicola TaxID=1513270 RepID=UPI0037366BED
MRILNDMLFRTAIFTAGITLAGCVATPGPTPETSSSADGSSSITRSSRSSVGVSSSRSSLIPVSSSSIISQSSVNSIPSSSASSHSDDATDTDDEEDSSALIKGERLYSEQCSFCHYDGEDAYRQAIAAGEASTDSKSLIDLTRCAGLDCSTQATLAAYILTDMPKGNPAGCANDCSQEIAKYILSGYESVKSNETPLSPLRRLTHEQYINSTKKLLNFGPLLDTPIGSDGLPGAPKVDAESKLPGETELEGLINIADTQKVNAQLASGYFENADTLAKIFVEYLNSDAAYKSALGCANNLDEATCASNFRKTFLESVLRRPVSAAELAEFKKVEDDVKGLYPDENKNEKRKLALRGFLIAALVSPEYIHLIERGQTDFNGGLKLRQIEVANRLAYLLSNSPPDQPLLEAAANNSLYSASVRAEHFNRLINKDGGKDNIQAILTRWLGIDLSGNQKQLLKALAPDTAKSYVHQQTYKDNAMAALDAFLKNWLANNEPFESFYSGSVRTRAVRGKTITAPLGIFGLQAFIGSHTTDTPSPITRGVFVAQHLLCGELPPPPAVAAPNPDDRPPGQTVKEWLQAAHAGPGCVGCHDTIDNYGFPFLRMDRYAVYDNRSNIDDSASLVTIGDLSGEVNGLEDFAKKVSESKQAQTCMANLMFRHVYGRYEHKTDKPKIDTIVDQWRSGSNGLFDLLEALVKSDDFITLVHQ